MVQRTLFGASLFAALLGSTALHADITAQQVWDNWKALGTASGQTMTAASESMEGDTLTVTGLDMVSTFEGGQAAGRIDEVKFREMGDGRVEITMSPDYTLTMNFTDNAGAPVEIGVAVSQAGMQMIAAGDNASTNYDFSAETVSVATTSVKENGVELPMAFALNGNAATGSYVMSEAGAGIVNLDSSAGFGDLSFTFSFNDTNLQTDTAIQGAVAGVTMKSAGTFGEGIMMHEELIDALRAGFRSSVALTYGPTQFSFNVTEARGATSGTGVNQGGSIAFAIDKSQISYKGGAKGVDISIVSPDIPFPQAQLAYAESVVDIVVPIGAAPESQDYTFVTKLIDLTVSDEIWSMIDPGATIPRDPATLIIDTTAKATLQVDLMDEAAMAALGGAPAGTIEALEIPALQLKIGGADLTGNGAFTFDNTDLTTFGGIPAPSGKLDLRLLGGNKLLDSLIALGVVPEDAAMQARMMMGMFARPGAEPDSLESTLEFKDGGFFANGMQLQ